MRAIGLVVLAVLAFMLSGCSADPSRSDVIERFTIEITAASGNTEADFSKLAEGMADDMLNGRCGNSAYRFALEEPVLIEAFDVTCLFYFEHDMSKAQIERAKQTLVEQATR